MQRGFACENIVSSLIINDEEEREIDVVVDKDKMYLPCKYILNFFEIPYKENHAEKSLSFKNVVLKSGSFMQGGIKQKYPVFFIKNGITNPQNEFFVPAEALAAITEKNIFSDSAQLAAFIKTKADKPQNYDLTKDSNPFLVKDGTIKAKAYDEITLPVKKGFISLDSVNVANNMSSDSYSQLYKDSQSKNVSMYSNMQVTLAGRLNSGEYKLGLGTNSYAKNWFSFTGISPQYKNRYKNFDYLIGKTDPWDFAQDSIDSDLMGIQLKDHVDKNISYRDIEGMVNPSSTVKVYINNDFSQELSTYGGYYSLRDIYYGKKIKTIKIDELLADGSSKEIFNKTFTEDINKKKIPKRDFIAGITGLQNRIWANNGTLYQANTRKGLLGFKYNKQLTNKLSFENFIIADKILSGNDENWSQSILGGNRYLNYITMRNINALEGQTYMGALSYKNNEKMDSTLIFGGSNSISKDGVTESGLGYYAQYQSNYHINSETSLKGSLFAGSPNFYLAGTSSGTGNYFSDRIGTSIGGNTRYKGISLMGFYSKYKSNFGNYYQGGLIDFDEYNIVARAHFKKLPNFNLKIDKKRGTNEIGEIDSESYEFEADKKIKCFDMKAGIRENSYSNKYSAEGYSSYSSKYSDVFAEIGFPIGKRFGNLILGHDIVKMLSDAQVNGYNSINVSYTTPCIKGINFNISTGLHYKGTTKGNDWGLGITKRLKSGSAVSMNYRYSQIPCYIIDNMYIPGSMRHSLTVDFTELYGVGSKGLQAIGAGNDNKGYLQVSAFLDINQNGIKDKGEPLIDNIPIKVENDSEILLTTKDGTTRLKAEDIGVHNVQIFEDQMPTLLSFHNKTKPSRYIKIDKNSKTTVEFGLISSVGNVNGSVTVKDEFNNSLKIDDLIVSVLDTEGKEVNYTNVNEDGTFSFSGLSPGKYVVGIDKELQDVYKIKPDTNTQNYVVVIPPTYKDYVNIDNVNLYYKYEI